MEHITLSGFIARMQQELIVFEDYWTQRNKEQPDIFPLEMAPEDWLEQIQINDYEDD
jgi:hypothetical protein